MVGPLTKKEGKIANTIINSSSNQIKSEIKENWWLKTYILKDETKK